MKQFDPRKQFSKRLARYGAVFWGLYLLIIAALIYFQPETAIACVYLVLIVTVNKMLDTWAYTKNSTYEKGLLAMLEKTKMELSLKGIAQTVSGKKTEKGDDSDEEGSVSEEDEGEEGGNG